MSREFEEVEFRGRKIKVTPARIERLEPGEVIVVPTNEAGIHGAGLALQAKLNFGLKQGRAHGLCGQSYALPTKRRPDQRRALNKIQEDIGMLHMFASMNLETFFLVPAIGTGLANIPVGVMADLCKSLSYLPNISLPKEFIEIYEANPEIFPYY